MENKNFKLRLDDFSFAVIPDGVIFLRDDRIEKSWEVNISSFFMAKFPITQKLYRAVSGLDPSVYKGDQHPVENVSWYDAIRFCNQLSGKLELEPFYKNTNDGDEVSIIPSSDGIRLPTEAEWEFACRAGSTKSRYGALDEIAWYQGNSSGRIHEVGQKQPNHWGIYDMLGNTWEWCWDQYDKDVYGEYRIFRGGGWADPERGCLATNRRRSHPTFKIDDLGFRIARNLKHT